MNSHFDKNKPVAIGSDHAGFDYKEDLISFLEGTNMAPWPTGSIVGEAASFAVVGWASWTSASSVEPQLAL